MTDAGLDALLAEVAGEHPVIPVLAEVIRHLRAQVSA